VYSNKCMNVSGASMLDGAKVIQYTCTDGATNEQWYLQYVGYLNGSDYYLLHARHSNKCLNVQYASLNNNALLIQYSCGNYTNEYVRFW
jgi:hypothetical protein